MESVRVFLSLYCRNEHDECLSKTLLHSVPHFLDTFALLLKMKNTCTVSLVHKSCFDRFGWEHTNVPLSLLSLSGVVRASCTWSSPSPQTAVLCWGRTALPSPPSPRSSITTLHTSCQSEEPSTCPCCTRSSCRPSDTDTLPLLVLLNTIYTQYLTSDRVCSYMPFQFLSTCADCRFLLFPLL